MSVSMGIGTLGNKRLTLRTALLEDKVHACNMIVEYARQLKGAFLPYVSDVTELMLTLLRFPYIEDVRTAAVETMPEMVKCTAIGVKQGVVSEEQRAQLWSAILAKLSEAMMQEADAENMCHLVSNMAECVEMTASDTLQLQLICQLVVKLITNSRERRARREEIGDDDAYGDDDDDGDEIEQWEDEILAESGELLGAAFRGNGERFAPVFIELMMPVLGQMLDGSRPTAERRLVLCAVDDLLEHGGERAALAHMEPFIPILLSNSKEASGKLREAAAYGLGVCAKHGGAQFGVYAPQVVQALSEMLSAEPKAARGAWFSALAAIGKVCVHQGSMSGRDELCSAWLGRLPTVDVDEDEDDAPVKDNMDVLAQMLESSAQLAPTLLPHAIKAAAKLCAVPHDEYKTQIDRLRQAVQKLPADQLQAGIVVLGEAERHAMLHA